MEATDWDLQAVVRGCGGGGAASRDPFSSFPPLLLQNGDGGGVDDNDMLFCFTNLLGTETSPPELEQLYKPFFPQSSPSPPQQQKALPFGSPTPTTTPCSSAALVLNPTGGFGAERTSQQRRPLPTTTTRSKRRKSQQKRVVCHVPADGLSCDMWAWRKYGQKPIKGSPYPRGYYRCSSSKGCLARKQVERCKTDPGVLVITYTAEHNHPIPTHRNSLAGITRQKLPDVSSSTTIQRVNSPSRVACSSLSPITPLTSSMDEEPQLTSKKEGREEVEEDEDEEEGMLLVSDMEMLGEDNVLFLGVDDIHQTSSDYHFQAPSPASQWMASSSTTMAAGGF